MNVEAPKTTARHTAEQAVPQPHINFSWAFQEAQVDLGLLSQLNDAELQTFIDSHPVLFGMNVEEVRNLFRQQREFFDWVLEMCYKYDLESTNPIDPEAVTKNHQRLDSRFPTVQDATGKIFRPLSSGVWSEVDGSEFFGVNTPEGQELSRIASEELSGLEQFFVLLLQMHPAFLLQKEYDLLYLFGFIDRRVILSEEQRELRIAMRIPIDRRSAKQTQLIKRFDVW